MLRNTVSSDTSPNRGRGSSTQGVTLLAQFVVDEALDPIARSRGGAAMGGHRTLWPSPSAGRLALVQDLLNTQASEEHRPDPLRDERMHKTGQRTPYALVRPTGNILPTTGIDERRCGKVAGLAGRTQRVLAGVPLGRLDSLPGTARFTLVDAAEIWWMPRGQGWRLGSMVPSSAKSC